MANIGRGHYETRHRTFSLLLTVVISTPIPAWDYEMDQGIWDSIWWGIRQEETQDRIRELEQRPQRPEAGSRKGSNTPPAKPKPWRVRIFDHLGKGQHNETTRITIGAATQTIIINKLNPTSFAEFSCPTGVWPYSLQSRIGLYNRQGKVVFKEGRGRGKINCNGNGNLRLYGNYYSTALVTLLLR